MKTPVESGENLLDCLPQEAFLGSYNCDSPWTEPCGIGVINTEGIPTCVPMSSLWRHHTRAGMYYSCPTNPDPHLQQTGGCLRAFAPSDKGGLLERPGSQEVRPHPASATVTL